MASLCWEGGDGRLTARRAVRRGSQAVPARAIDPPATLCRARGNDRHEVQAQGSAGPGPDWRAPPAPRHCRTTGDEPMALMTGTRISQADGPDGGREELLCQR